jgi:type III secretory pathway component EscU
MGIFSKKNLLEFLKSIVKIAILSFVIYKVIMDSLPLLMNNPETTPEQLVLASKLYTNVTQQLHDHAKMIDTFIYHGHKLAHMRSCPTYRTGNEELCECKDWQGEGT